MRIFTLVAALLVALTPGAASAQVPTGAPIAPLAIDVVALDKDDRPVMDLKREELEVWISGYRVPIDTLTAVTSTAERAERSIILILDDVTLDPSMIRRVKDVALRFVNRMLPGDSMAIVTFDGRTMEMSDDRARLTAAIDDYSVRASGVRRLDLLGEQVLNMTALISRQLAKPADRRKAIVAIGAAWLFDTPLPQPQAGRELRKEWTDAMRAAAFSNVSLYVIEPAGLGVSRSIGGSYGFAHETGGYAFVNTNDFNGAVDRIMRETSNYYILEVSDPPVQRKSELRQLDVKVLRKGVTVRARGGIPGTDVPAKRPER